MLFVTSLLFNWACGSLQEREQFTSQSADRLHFKQIIWTPKRMETLAEYSLIQERKTCGIPEDTGSCDPGWRCFNQGLSKGSKYLRQCSVEILFSKISVFMLPFWDIECRLMRICYNFLWIGHFVKLRFSTFQTATVGQKLWRRFSLLMSSSSAPTRKSCCFSLSSLI